MYNLSFDSFHCQALHCVLERVLWSQQMNDYGLSKKNWRTCWMLVASTLNPSAPTQKQAELWSVSPSWSAEGCRGLHRGTLSRTNKRKEPKYHGGAFHSCGNRENFLEIMFTLELQAAVTTGFTWIWEFRWAKSCTVKKVRSCASLVRGKMVSCPLRNDVLVPGNRTER